MTNSERLDSALIASKEWQTALRVHEIACEREYQTLKREELSIAIAVWEAYRSVSVSMGYLVAGSTEEVKVPSFPTLIKNMKSARARLRIAVRNLRHLLE